MSETSARNINNKTYSLKEASLLCGMSLNRFRAHKEEFISFGATVDRTGWVIPHSALVNMNWLGVKPPREKEEMVKASVLLQAHEQIMQLKAAIVDLEAQLASPKKGIFGIRSKR